MGEYQQIQNRDTEEMSAMQPIKQRGRCASCSLWAVVFAMSLTSVLFLVVWMIAFPKPATLEPVPCNDPCTIILAESIPWNLTFKAASPYYQSTYGIWKRLVLSAQETIDISSMYWTLRGQDIFNDSSDAEGEDIFRELMTAGTRRNISIRIVENMPNSKMADKDTKELSAKGAAMVRILNFTRLMGGGILHTKFWIVDGQHLYIGSANMDYRSLTQVKEIGVGVFNCSCLAQDLKKLFDVYWYLGDNTTTVPPHWPKQYSTLYNVNSPMDLTFNGTNATAFIGSSPPPFCPSGRTSDIDGLLHVIDSAQKYIYIAVMDYVPEKEFSSPRKYWDVIDAKLRQVAFDHHVEIRLMGSLWNHTPADMMLFLKSFAQLGTTKRLNISVKLFKVPAYTPVEHRIPYSRVNHNKYMVTDNAAYIGTSNWSKSYFTLTGGASLVVNQTLALTDATLQKQLTDLFERDWYSQHAQPIVI